MKQYLIFEDLLEEAVAGLNVFGGVAVGNTVEKLKQLEEVDLIESVYQQEVKEGSEGIVMRPSMNPYNPLGK
jgi:ATP-dependent DNA ligase